jgi:ribosomal protein S18 acetylase RimI-like enzyme
MIEKVKIIDATPEDAWGITNVFYKTWLATYPNKEIGVTVEDIEDSYKDEFSPEKIENLKQIIQNVPKNTKRLVAKVGNEIVGAGTFVRRDEYNHVRTLYVLPEFQHKGIGTMFWDEAKKFFDPEKDTIVQVAEYTEDAINFYKKLGFVDTGKRTKEESEKLKSGAVIVDMEMVIKASKIQRESLDINHIILE